MKHTIQSLKSGYIALFLLIFTTPILAEEEKSNYGIEPVIELKCTEVKDQGNTGTCWSFSTTSFIESELMRMGKGQHNLSEMFNVRYLYPQKAENYVRHHGTVNFGSGSLTQDMLRIFSTYGAIPEQVYSGRENNNLRHNHQELDAVLKGFLDAVINNRSRKISPAWKEAFAGILDAYLGKVQTQFEYKGKSYTPKTFAQSLGLNPDDYIEFTSYQHHPFNTFITLELPDNWARNKAFNIPLKDLLSIMHYALENGYSLEWDGDTTEKTFNQEKGLAILPAKHRDEMTSSEKDSLFVNPVEELNVTQALRQAAFDNYTSKDDHLMHIIGISKDKNGKKYFITKNSWGKDKGPYNGFIHMSEAYVRSKTISILLHKDAVPKAILNRVK